MLRKPMSIGMIESIVDRTFDEADQYTWANRAVVHCADVINLCFGPPWTGYYDLWRRLNTWNRNWEKFLPPSCQRIYSGVDTTDRRRFPKILYHNGCQGMSSLSPRSIDHPCPSTRNNAITTETAASHWCPTPPVGRTLASSIQAVLSGKPSSVTDDGGEEKGTFLRRRTESGISDTPCPENLPHR